MFRTAIVGLAMAAMMDAAHAAQAEGIPATGAIARTATNIRAVSRQRVFLQRLLEILRDAGVLQRDGDRWAVTHPPDDAHRDGIDRCGCEADQFGGGGIVGDRANTRTDRRAVQKGIETGDDQYGSEANG